MSLWGAIKSVGKGLLSAAPGALAGASQGGIPGAIAGGVSSFAGAKLQSSTSKLVAGGVGAGMAGFPAIRTLGAVGAVAGAGGYVVRGARALYYSAASYCRKYPTWCSSIGGIAAVEALVSSGQLPPIKRRRRKGITPRDLSSFRRVASLIKSYGPTARRVPSSCAPRRSCRKT